MNILLSFIHPHVVPNLFDFFFFFKQFFVFVFKDIPNSLFMSVLQKKESHTNVEQCEYIMKNKNNFGLKSGKIKGVKWCFF